MSFHLGIVVQNNDPKKRGRVKIFIPHISLNYKENWEDTNADKSFDKLSGTEISKVIDSIKHLLPWANYAAPIMGENGNHYFNASDKSVNKSDNKKAKQYEDSPLTDNFGKTYTPSAYDDAAKGLFSIPKVGSKVWVFFENNNPQRPTYFATSYSKEDWVTINKDSGDYPDELENNPNGTDTTHKNKMVISQNGAVIEIINTDGEEEIKITQHNGSFISLKNDTTEEFVEGSDHKLIQNDKTLHVGGNHNEYVGGNQGLHVVGNDTELVDKNQTQTIKGNQTQTIKGNQTILIEGSQDVTVKGDQNVTIDGSQAVSVTGNVNISVTGNCSVASNSLVEVAAPDIILTGDVTIDGALSQGAGGQGATMQGPITVVKEIVSDSDIIAGSDATDGARSGVSLFTHTHGGVAVGGLDTDVPN